MGGLLKISLTALVIFCHSVKINGIKFKNLFHILLYFYNFILKSSSDVSASHRSRASTSKRRDLVVCNLEWACFLFRMWCVHTVTFSVSTYKARVWWKHAYRKQYWWDCCNDWCNQALCDSKSESSKKVLSEIIFKTEHLQVWWEFISSVALSQGPQKRSKIKWKKVVRQPW